MTPQHQPVKFSYSFQNALLIFILGGVLTILVKGWNFSVDLSTKMNDYGNHLEQIDKRLDRHDDKLKEVDQAMLQIQLQTNQTKFIQR